MCGASHKHHHDDDIVVVGCGGAAFEVAEGDGVRCSGEDLGVADTYDELFPEFGDSVENAQFVGQPKIFSRFVKMTEITPAADQR